VNKFTVDSVSAASEISAVPDIWTDGKYLDRESSGTSYQWRLPCCADGMAVGFNRSRCLGHRGTGAPGPARRLTHITEQGAYFADAGRAEVT